MKLFLLIIVVFSLSAFNLFSFTEYFDNTSTITGTSMIFQSPAGVGMNFNMLRIRINDVIINNNPMHRIIIPEIYGHAKPGNPDFPRISRLVAIPQGSNVFVNITGSRKRIFRNITPSPAPESIPHNPANPIIYKPDSSVYFGNSIYPEEIIYVSEPFKIRGVDVVQVTLEPFQWDPKTKDLTVYTNVSFHVSFTGGTGHIGEDRLRSRFWDRILQCNIVNYQSLDRIDYSKRARDAATALSEGYPYGAEFVIIVPDDSIFLAWADSIKKLRTEDGVITEIHTLIETGTSFDEIETWIDYAYYSWNIPPEGILFLADYNDAQFSDGITSKPFTINDHGFTRWVSDNYYADIDEDTLPEIVIGRIPVRNREDLENVIGKLLRYEKNPFSNSSFYSNVLVSGNFDYYAEFHVQSEIIKGFFEDVYDLNKNVTRLYKCNNSESYYYINDSLEPGDLWIYNATGPYWLIDYFNSLGYIDSFMTYDFINSDIWDKSATDINNTINAGCFMVFNIGHGGVGDSIPEPAHWSRPRYNASDLYNLNNYDELPYVYAYGCWTGKFDDAFAHHAETFLLLPSEDTINNLGRGSIGNTAASYKWGWYGGKHFLGSIDYMWKNFDPNYPITGSSSDTFHEAMPGFALVSGKHYDYFRTNCMGPHSEQTRFHHFGDPYQRLYTEVPQVFADDDIQYNSTLSAGVTYFNVLSPINSFITLINEGRIIGRALSYGNPVNIPLVPQEEGTEVEIVVTKQNYYRYYDTISVIPTTGPYVRFIEMDTITGGHENRQLNPGLKYSIKFEFANFGNTTAQEPYFYLSSTDTNIVIGNAEYTPRSINAYDTVYVSFPCSLKSNITDRHEIPIALKYGYNGSDTLFEDFELIVHSPVIEVEQAYTDTNDFYPGDSIFVGIEFHNIGTGTTYENVFDISTEHSMITLNGLETIFDTLMFNKYLQIDSSYQFIISLEPESFWINYDSLDILCEVQIIASGNCTCFDSFTLNITDPVKFRDNFEEFDSIFWGYSGDSCWNVSPNNFYSGSKSMYNGLSDTMYDNNITDARIATLSLDRIKENEKYILSFWHWYDLQEGYDGVQIQINYDTTLEDTTWLTLNPIEGYSGVSNGYGGFTSGDSFYTGTDTVWQQQHFVVDSFIGQNFHSEEVPYICWRFGSDDSIVKEGYYFDDVIVFRYRNDNSEYSELSKSIIEEVYRYSLSMAGPNIIRNRAVIGYSIADETEVKLIIYDILGREVRTLVNGSQRPGRYRVEWDGRDMNNRSVSSGIYFYRLVTDDFKQVNKLTVVR